MGLVVDRYVYTKFWMFCELQWCYFCLRIWLDPSEDRQQIHSRIFIGLYSIHVKFDSGFGRPPTNLLAVCFRRAQRKNAFISSLRKTATQFLPASEDRQWMLAVFRRVWVKFEGQINTAGAQKTPVTSRKFIRAPLTSQDFLLIPNSAHLNLVRRSL